MQATTAAIDLIKQFEGFSSKPYLCPAGVATIGYGSTRIPDDKPVTMKHPPIDEEEAQEWLEGHVAGIAAGLHMRTKSTEINQNQFDALVSFVYNLGFGNFDASTLYKLLRAGKIADAGAQLQRWNKSDGKELAGLTRRRKAEYDLFTKRVAK